MPLALSVFTVYSNLKLPPTGTRDGSTCTVTRIAATALKITKAQLINRTYRYLIIIYQFFSKRFDGGFC